MEITTKGIIDIWGFADKSKSQEFTNLRIPFYQRPFKWEEGNIESLFDDFFGRNAGKGHYFVGSAIAYVLDNSKAPEIAEYEVVDGQQRLTTLFLLNYLRFLISRAFIEEEIKARRDIRVDYKPLIEKYKGFFGNNNSAGNNIELMEHNYEEIETEVEKSSGADYDNILALFRTAIGLPDIDETEPDYETIYRDKLFDFLNNETFVISYDRTTLNQKLKEALCSVRFSLSERDIYPSKDDYPTDEIVKKYIETIAFLYKHVRIKVNADLKGSTVDDLKYTKKCIELIDKMLNGLQICLLTSDSQDDAYTLFEVLNDRGYDMSDLELMKNMILKQYWSSTTDADKENKIEKLDDLWEDVFDPNMSNAQRDLIAYLGTIYLSGDKTTVPLNIKTPYRSLIKEKRYKDGRKPYNYTEAINDIAFFSMSKIIIEEAGLKYKKLYTESVSAENTTNSLIYKTLHLLHATKCDGVLPAIVNVLINDYKQTRGIDYERNEIDLKDFRDYAKNAMTSSPGASALVPKAVVYKLADKLWKYVLLSSDFRKPREAAANIIKSCWRDKYEEKKILDYIDLNATVGEHNKWIEEWRYGKDDILKHRIMISIMRLFREYEKKEISPGKEQLEISSYLNNFAPDADVNLDHLEPKNVNPKKKGDYFEENDIEKREDITNSIGNMMVLDFKNNLRKDNEPLYEGINSFYSKIPAQARSFLYEDMKDLLSSNNIKGNSVPEVPTEMFFEERKKRLICYIQKMLTSDYKQSPITL